MTDCIHNDKRTCLHERMELVAEIEKLKAENAKLRERSGQSPIAWRYEHNGMKCCTPYEDVAREREQMGFKVVPVFTKEELISSI